MPSFESAFEIISDLVKDFKENEKSILHSGYSEWDVRNDYINKFFNALGWDVGHDHQKNPYEQEVRIEKPVQVAKAQKRADYTFYLSPNFRDVKFFVEAKKPYHDLENKDYYFQTVRYGWNANTPIAVLTDFEEFVILDCRYRPDIKDILNYKINSFHYSDYTNEDKFKKIYYLFSREAVADQSIEKYSDNLPKPKGKGIKKGTFTGNFQSIDESFLNELDEIRTDLAKSFKKNNSHLTSDELTEATQRTIDRLVFIKFLEDRLIEPHHYVSEFGKRKSAWEDFTTASLTLDAKYNGVVFKKSLIDSRNIIEPDDKTFSKICEDLSHENTPYNFDAIPIHILGSIYERFLGKVVNATDKRVTIEEKPEVRKAGGVYYTPQYIVNYIVENTIGKLIENKTPKEISKMHFADIACGSGSFLITVYERLLDHHKRWYIDNPGQAKKDGCILYEGVYRLSLQQKQKILTDNIIGVDIDQQAVEVTQLSLYLKLLEDETTATANDTWVMFKEKLLPNLNKNIICGNSLISTDILDGSFFDYEEERKLKPLDFKLVFMDVMKAGGFDAIVGNPPYVTIGGKEDTLFTEKETKYLLANYLSNQYKPNLYAFFYEKGFQLLKKKGLISLIVPRTFIDNIYYKKLREHFVNNSNIISLSKLNYEVFKGATTGGTLICVFKKLDKPNSKIKCLEAKDSDQFSKQNSIIIDQQNILVGDYKSFSFIDNTDNILITKISKGIPTLDYYCSVNNGANTGNAANILLSDTPLNNKYRKILEGKDINRYLTKWKGLWINYDPMLKKKIKLSDLKTKQNKIDFALRDVRIFDSTKIIVRQTSDKIIATLDCDKYITRHSTHLILNDFVPINLTFLLGLLNSSLINFFYTNLIPEKGKAFAEVKAINLRQLPIKYANEMKNENDSRCKKISSLVEQMLSSRDQLEKAKTGSDKNYLERKCESLNKLIDELVFDLYGLNNDERKIIENSLT